METLAFALTTSCFISAIFLALSMGAISAYAVTHWHEQGVRDIVNIGGGILFLIVLWLLS